MEPTTMLPRALLYVTWSRFAGSLRGAKRVEFVESKADAGEVQAAPTPGRPANVNGSPQGPQSGDSSAKRSDERVDRSMTETRKHLDAVNRLSFNYPVAWKEMAATEAKQLMATWKEKAPAEGKQLFDGVASKYLTVVVYNPEDWTENVNVQVLTPVASKDLHRSCLSRVHQANGRRVSERPSRVPENVVPCWTIVGHGVSGVCLRDNYTKWSPSAPKAVAYRKGRSGSRNYVLCQE